MSELIAALEAKKVVPLVQSDDPKTALKVSEALLEGGLEVLEVVLRTDAALDCLEEGAPDSERAIPRLGLALADALQGNPEASLRWLTEAARYIGEEAVGEHLL